MGLGLPPSVSITIYIQGRNMDGMDATGHFRAINHGGLLHLVTPQDATLCNLLVVTQQLEDSMNHCLDCNRHYLPVGNLRTRLDSPMAGCWVD